MLLRLRAGLADMRNVLVEEALPGGAVRAADWDGVETAAGLEVVKGRAAAEEARERAMCCM